MTKEIRMTNTEGSCGNFFDYVPVFFRISAFVLLSSFELCHSDFILGPA
jgi:hypothetical protein